MYKFKFHDPSLSQCTVHFSDNYTIVELITDITPCDHRNIELIIRQISVNFELPLFKHNWHIATANELYDVKFDYSKETGPSLKMLITKSTLNNESLKNLLSISSPEENPL